MTYQKIIDDIEEVINNIYGQIINAPNGSDTTDMHRVLTHQKAQLHKVKMQRLMCSPNPMKQLD